MLLSKLQLLQKPPTDINILGRILPCDEKNIIVVGTRKYTSYGRRVIEWLIPKLVKEGYTIISGLAKGCDMYAHQVTINSHGRSIGVCGYGLDSLRQDMNYSLIKKMFSTNRLVIVSPFPRRQLAQKFTYIYRNTVMAALGNSVLVIEAGLKSGVFYTVNTALELGKDIYVVPGNIFNNKSQGCNKLIKEGAFLVNSISDFTAG